jgi:monoamine oxidase
VASSSLTRFLIVGAGAAGLMNARELARAGKQVVILEARDRCGGRIYQLSAQEFGYPAEGGAEFVHGAAPVTRALMREAGLSLLPIEGTGVPATAHSCRAKLSLLMQTYCTES